MQRCSRWARFSAARSPEDQSNVAGGVRTGTARLTGGGRHWDGAAKAAGCFRCQGRRACRARRAGARSGQKLQAAPNAPAWYHPGRSGTLQLGPKTVLAHFGELHPETLKALDIKGAAAVFEVFLDQHSRLAQEGNGQGRARRQRFPARPARFRFHRGQRRGRRLGDAGRGRRRKDPDLAHQRFRRVRGTGRARRQEVARPRNHPDACWTGP